MKKMLIISALVLTLLPLGAVYHKIGEFNTQGNPQCVASAGNIVYVADGDLQIIDVSNPLDPILLSTFDTPDAAKYVTVKDSLAYVVLAGPYSNIGLMVINVSNPLMPNLAGTWLGNQAWNGQVTISDNIAYLLCPEVADAQGYWFTNLYCIDVSNPQSPNELGYYYTSTHGYSISVENDIACMAAAWSYSGPYPTRSSAELQIIDVSIPQNPVLLSSFPCRALSVTVRESIAYVSTIDSLLVIDISNPQSPFLLGSYSAGDEDIVFDGWLITNSSIKLEDNMIYLADEYYGLRVIDISDLEDPFLLGTYTCDAQSAAIIDNVAYLAAKVGNCLNDCIDNGGMEIIDLSNPQNPSLLSLCDTPGSVNAVSVNDDIAYVADGISGLRVINVSNPQNPVLLSSIDTYASAMSLVVEDDRAYVAEKGITGFFTAGLKIFDVSNPQNPGLLGFFESENAMFVCVENGIAYVADAFSGLRLVDVSNPQSPSLLGSYNHYPGSACCVSIADNIAFVTFGFVIEGYGWDGKLEMLDVSNPSNPYLTGSYDTPGTAYYVSVEGAIASVADGSYGTQLIDISAPSSPVLISNIPTYHAFGNISRCQIYGSLLFTSDTWWNEINVYDINNPQFPVLIYRYAWNLSSWDMVIDGNVMYTANGCSGLGIHNLASIDVDDPVQIPPSAFQMRNYPNPFNPETTISYTLPSAGLVSLEIYNSRGQLVRSLLQEEQSAGEHTLIWNGKDDSGHSVASGLYLCRIACNGKHETRKMLLLK